MHQKNKYSNEEIKNYLKEISNQKNLTRGDLIRYYFQKSIYYEQLFQESNNKKFEMKANSARKMYDSFFLKERFSMFS